MALRRFIPMPLDWPRSRVFRQLRQTDPGAIWRFLWLLNQAHQVNRAGRIDLANGQALTAEDCAAETDQDVDGWNRSVDLLVQLDLLHVDDEGMQLLCWAEWRRDAGSSGPWFVPVPLDWTRSRSFRELRAADPGALWRFLWLLNQAHQVGLGGQVRLEGGEALTAEDCAAETDQDVVGWQRSAELLELVDLVATEGGLRVLNWAGECRDRRERSEPTMGADSARPPAPAAQPQTVAKRAKRLRKPRQTLEEKRKSNAYRQACFKARRAGLPEPERPPHMSNAQGNAKSNAPPMVTHEGNALPTQVTQMEQKVTPVTQKVTLSHEHEHEDRYLHEEYSIDHHAAAPPTPSPRPPLMSDDDRMALFCKEFWEDWGEVVNGGFQPLIGRALTVNDWKFAVGKLLAAGHLAVWQEASPQARAYAIAWSCEKVRAMIAAGDKIANPWPYALKMAWSHVDVARHKLRQDAFMAKRGIAAKPLLYVNPTEIYARRKAAG